MEPLKINHYVTLDMANYIMDKVFNGQLLVAFRLSMSLPEPTVFFSSGKETLYVNINNKLVVHDDIELRPHDRQIYWARYRDKTYSNEHTSRQVSHW